MYLFVLTQKKITLLRPAHLFKVKFVYRLDIDITSN